ncbi:MAG TPA: DUF5682 family protein, partial [Roseiflexaceae bacterium]|nr:DUF5682 family protein [Roseiflexaceae bacterium]
FAAIDHQFGHPAGTTGLADAALHKAARASGVTTFNLAKPDSGKPSKRRLASHGVRIRSVLAARPSDDAADHEQLLVWSAQIVALARKNGYLASTADSIAIFQTTLLLAQLRNRPRPSSYDFQDAAITCLEKDRTPRKRTIAQICQFMLGGDRVGTVGYSSLPPLVQELFDRLAPLHLNLMARTNQRALMDFRQHPELRVCSDALWKLHYVLGNQVAEPIVGERTLGQVALQESWDVRLGREQRAIIQLGYEGITIEQVLEQRMKQAAFGDDATAAQALRVAEDALLFMGRPRLVRELGEQATHLLANESGAQDAPDIFERARRLAHFFRSQPDGLPAWLQTFVATGYAHYATLLPRAFGDQGSSPEQIAGMLGFIFTLENFALALGLQRQQIALAIQQASQSHVPAEKLGLLWTAEWLVQQRELASISDYCAALLGDALRLPALPAFLHGFVLSLTFAPGIAPVVVELFSRVFGCLPDTQLLPLLPGLIIQLRRSPQIVRALVESAGGLFPANLAQLAAWQAPWEMPQAADPVECPVVAPVSATVAATHELILAAPAASQALAALLQGLPKP